jgi:hypothetical protein
MAVALAVHKLALAAASLPDPLPMQIGLRSGQQLLQRAEPTSIFASLPP